MRNCYGWIALWVLLPVVARAQQPCSATALPQAAKAVDALRHQLHAVAVPAQSPEVPAPVQADLTGLKAALAQAAGAAFACAPAEVDPKQLEAELATALHANLADAGEAIQSVKGKDLGAYGSDLAVQVLPLSTRPQIVEVDFRFGIECGDDNLLLIYERDARAGQPWTETLRWTHTGYSDVRDALGDFVMLTPLTGSYRSPRWRYVVAHGQPGCGDGTRPGTFALDLLEPTKDPAVPHVAWHFTHAYTAGAQEPRLQTTEDSIDFRLASPGDGMGSGGQPVIYRFHLAQNGKVEPGPSTTPTPAGGSETRTAHAGQPPATRSPQ